jgi:hypothetical protein
MFLVAIWTSLLKISAMAAMDQDRSHWNRPLMNPLYHIQDEKCIAGWGLALRAHAAIKRFVFIHGCGLYPSNHSEGVVHGL